MSRMGSIPTALVNDAFVKKDSITTRGKRDFNVELFRPKSLLQGE